MDFAFPVNFYFVLNVSSTATVDEIRTSYKKLALMYHPDKNPNCGDRFKAISYAHQVLTDPEKLAVYLAYGIEGLKDKKKCSKSFFNGTHRFQLKNCDIPITYEVTLEDLYVGKRGRVTVHRQVICFRCLGTGKEPRVEPPPRLNHDCEITYYHFRNDEEPREKKPSMSHVYDRSYHYNGAGGDNRREYSPREQPKVGYPKKINISPAKERLSLLVYDVADRYSTPSLENVCCTKCSGEKVCKVPKILDFQIEAGMRDKQKIEFAGEGHQAVRKKPGSVVITLKETPHEVFHRIADDLFVEKEITQAQASRGFSFELKHLDGEVHIYKLPPGVCNTESGIDHVENHPNEGMPALRDDTKKGRYLHEIISSKTEECLGRDIVYSR